MPHLAQLRKSESTLREQVAHEDRQGEGHPDHTDTWLFRITDQLIEDKRRLDNIDARINLVATALILNKLIGNTGKPLNECGRDGLHPGGRRA